MDQQQFKIRMSLSTKLLLLISILLTTPIFFLNFSAITLFKNDKKAYVYDSQATAVALAGREFVSYVSGALGTLKIILGSSPITSDLSAQAKSQIQFYLDNQHALLGADLYLFDPVSGDASPIHRQFIPNALKESGLTESDTYFDPARFKRWKEELSKYGYVFKNISKEGLSPVLAILFIDQNALKELKPTPLAVGYVGLRHLLGGPATSFNKFIISDRDGTVLFATDVKTLFAKTNLAQEAIFKEARSSTVRSGAKEYSDQTGFKNLGSFYKPGLDLLALSVIEYDKAMQTTETLSEKFLILGLASLSLMVALGTIFSKRLTAPLNRLFKATAQVSEGHFNINLPITSSDEIGALTSSFSAMSRKISELVQGRVDAVRVEQEMTIAKTVQQSLFPPEQMKNECLELSSIYRSASDCGGDWWGYFHLNKKHVLMIADATGHGLPSALMTAAARSCFSIIEKLAGDGGLELEPARILEIFNRVVFDSAQGKIMMTGFVCVLDFETHQASYASAAHNPGWLITNAHQITSLVASGPRLGEAQSLAAPYDVKVAPFQLGDTLVLYTDGLLDGKSINGESYGKKQARRVIDESIGQNPEAIVKALLGDFQVHISGKPLDDDITIAVARILS